MKPCNHHASNISFHFAQLQSRKEFHCLFVKGALPCKKYLIGAARNLKVSFELTTDRTDGTSQPCNFMVKHSDTNNNNFIIP